ncbi:peptidase family C50-domain-containing protein [Neohortaea acidophila]|uniref:separase n=1 Tax=Neohortaea acidophila TaxID=245834 RepID=A0A6A6Q523_9PEZI|nr:peptidase family C50-domain-containing protein [Neohortaea acidophila]KAF2486743.1 peptidase family C50-domain-containing protein [Neohortaea acidophila]
MEGGKWKLQELESSLAAGSATEATVSALQSFLGLERPNSDGANGKKPVDRPNDKSRGTADSRKPKPVASKTKKNVSLFVREDRLPTLSVQEKHRLATHAANASLKVLSGPCKAAEKTASGHCQDSDSDSTTPPRKAGDLNVLQSRSSNTVPDHPSPEKTKAIRGAKSTAETIILSNAPIRAVHVAECADVAFAFLRSLNYKECGIREPPKWQLEQGMLCLAGLAITHGFRGIAVKQLRRVKSSLEHRCHPVQGPKPVNRSSPSNETFGSMLCLSNALVMDQDALRVAISFHYTVLRTLSLPCKAAVYDEVLGHDLVGVRNSPADVIMQQYKCTGDNDKATKHLDALSRTILAFCPPIVASADAAALNTEEQPSPKAAFEFQVLSLRIRKLSWNLANHRQDPSKDLLDPFYRCALTFIRRGLTLDADTVHQTLERCFESLGPCKQTEPTPSLFQIYQLMCVQAEEAGMYDAALKWAECMEEDCSTLKINDARQVMCVVKRTTLMTKISTSAAVFDLLLPMLQSTLSGARSDHGDLLKALAQLTRRVRVAPAHSQSASARRLSHLAAIYASGCAQHYPSSHVEHIRIILEDALVIAQSTEDIIEWASGPAVQTFVDSGSARDVARAAASQCLGDAWKISTSVLSLSRILHALTIKTAREPNAKIPPFFDDESLQACERGILLEWQLKCMVELSGKLKYSSALQKLLPQLLQALAKIYTPSEFPLRRARVAIVAWRLLEGHPDLLPSQDLNVWLHPALDQIESLGADVGLKGYFGDLQANLAVARLFEGGRPQAKDLQSALTVWQRIVDNSTSSSDLRGHVDDLRALLQQLDSLVAYFRMTGKDAGALAAQRILVKLTRLHDDRDFSPCDARTALSRLYIQLGESETASAHLDEARNALEVGEVSPLAKLNYQLARAECFLATDNLDDCRAALAEAERLLPQHHLGGVTGIGGRRQALLSCQAKLVHSKLSLRSAFPHQALAAASQSVRGLKALWSHLEGAWQDKSESSTVETARSELDEVTRKVSKLDLGRARDSPSSETNERLGRGAPFWPVMPLLIEALLHLSDVYAHHGIFHESDYHSQRAMQIAESVGSTAWLSRIRSCRSQLLLSAGRLEDAELCLAQNDTCSIEELSLASVERQCARAAVYEKSGSLEDALATYEKAESYIRQMFQRGFAPTMESLAEDTVSREDSVGVELLCETAKGEFCGDQKRPASKVRAAPVPKTGRKRGPIPASKPMSKSHADGANTRPSYSMEKLQRTVLLRKTLVQLRLGNTLDPTKGDVDVSASRSTMDLQLLRNAQFQIAMSQALKSLEMDVTLNVLLDSTLIIPGLRQVVAEQPQPTKSQRRLPASAKASNPTKKPARKAITKTTTVADNFLDLIKTARGSLLLGYDNNHKLCGTSATHTESAMLLSAGFYMSAASGATASQLDSAVECFALDFPRVKALQYEQQAVALSGSRSESPSSSVSPHLSDYSGIPTSTTAAEFQRDFIDILPKSWTAVSLCLSADCRELYIARYDSGQTPLILRLPLLRHSPSGLDDEEVFDFHYAKSDLQDIIDMSNYSCHNPQGTNRHTWWSAREELDRRLHDLLINIEDIWLRGFKGIFAPSTTRQDSMRDFRKSFEEILGRYLPSRKGTRRQTEALSVDDKILELFVGLGDDHDGEIDLDESLADLLEFVVDMLQFGGERNACDEIDFDGMTVDMFDALRAYHEDIRQSHNDQPHQHLILVLDRRLQAFPWESLPCLEKASVSRVGSMLSIRERILALRAAQNEPSGKHVDRIVADATSGTYILNPSSNLPNTQAALEPVLSGLKQQHSSNWQAIVNEGPDEDRFATAIAKSSILMYFGHGAGSSFIRPSTIQRLSTCCDVAWLMGCSSGTVHEHGDFEPSAVPLDYLLAGTGRQSDTGTTNLCKAVVANLWDVTDKDIDRFSLRLGEEWGLWPASEQARVPIKSPKKRNTAAVPSTPQRAPKTPKTPRVAKTPAPFKTPARRGAGSLEGVQGKRSLVEAVSRSREACYLRYLNGAAPVVYGVPVYLGD